MQAASPSAFTIYKIPANNTVRVNFSVVYPSRRDITMKKLHRRVLGDMVGDVEEEEEEDIWVG